MAYNAGKTEALENRLRVGHREDEEDEQDSISQKPSH